MLWVLAAGLTIFALTDAAFAQAAADQTEQDNFLFNLSVVMDLEKLCPSIQLDKEATRQKSTEAGVDLSKGVSPQKYPNLAKDFYRAKVFVTMMNDAGGPFPCAQIAAQKGKPGNEKLEFLQLVQPSIPQ